jgi:predicted pyridoxine 5'-phosphate oxidase superfamily flavin-nucleotide-binding protein
MRVKWPRSRASAGPPRSLTVQDQPGSLGVQEVTENESACTAGEQLVQDAFGTRDRADRFCRDQVTGHLTGRMREFITRMDMVWVATSDASGECDCSFRSGPAGFVQVLDERRLAYPDYRGNGVMASSGNIVENPHIGLWFGDFDQDLIGLHVNGRAVVLTAAQMSAIEPGLPPPANPGQRPVHWVLVEVKECFVHCRKHLPRLVRQPRDRHWGTDSPLEKGGDYFGAAAPRTSS